MMAVSTPRDRAVESFYEPVGPWSGNLYEPVSYVIEREKEHLGVLFRLAHMLLSVVGEDRLNEKPFGSVEVRNQNCYPSCSPM